MEKAIKKAIEGGYRKDRTSWDRVIIDGRGFYHKVNSDIRVLWQEIVCEPEFWQCLGKALGHVDKNYPNGEMRCENNLGRCEARYCEYGGFRDPKQTYMYFMEHIWEGKSLDSFFEELLKD